MRDEALSYGIFLRELRQSCTVKSGRAFPKNRIHTKRIHCFIVAIPVSTFSIESLEREPVKTHGASPDREAWGGILGTFERVVKKKKTRDILGRASEQ